MSFLGKLIVDKQEFNILKLKLSFYQPTDANGKPNANPNGGFIYVSLESSGRSNPFLGWMLDPESTKDGELNFIGSTYDNPSRIITFKKAFCVGYDEDFSAAGSGPMTIQLVISAKTIKDGEAVHEKAWDH